MTGAFECVAARLPAIGAKGIRAVFSLGNFNTTNDTYAMGEEAAFGGLVEENFGTTPQTRHYITTPEVAWVVEELEKRNLTQHVSQFFLHDDMADVVGNTADTVAWMRKHTPHITPQANTFPDSGPETLYS